ncbi:MAG: hypothetical protein WCA98_16410 [Candidatus Acidiferrales bacterium]
MIFASALAFDAELITSDAHFNGLPSITQFKTSAILYSGGALR